MYIEWEDRKNQGSIDGQRLSEKPEFSFNYAWFRMDEGLAEFVESHDKGIYNKVLSQDQQSEILTFYSNVMFDGVEPEFNSDIERIEPSEVANIIDGKRYTSFDIIPLTASEITAKTTEKIQTIKEEKRNQIRSEFALAISPPVDALGFTWNSGFNSSLSIDGAARIAAAAGFTEVTIHSLDNKPHTLSLADATQVAVIIGGAYQQQLVIKQARMVAVDEVDLAASDAVEQINVI